MHDVEYEGDALVSTIGIVLSELQFRIPPHCLPKYDVSPMALCNYSENETMESLRSRMDCDPTALLSKFFFKHAIQPSFFPTHLLLIC